VKAELCWPGHWREREKEKSKNMEEEEKKGRICRKIRISGRIRR
jgi:hypothetical protein